ncbi:MAG TPA: hypothetical protein VGN14_10295 [Candidatus Elarobacter sp.]
MRARGPRIAVIALVCFVLLFTRRWDQLVHPQVWNEDGTRNIVQLLRYGPVTVLWPVNGYLITISRLITFISLAISPLAYPAISTVLAWAFIVAVGVAIAISPVSVRGGLLLTLAAFLVPSDPEVFGIPLYAFWWAGLLVVLAALWRRDAGSQAWRAAFIVLGGLSSPLIVLALPVFIYRAVAFRDDVRERVFCGLALACAAVQEALIAAHGSEPHRPLSGEFAYVLVTKFLGAYPFGAFAHHGESTGRIALAAGAAVTIAVVAWAMLAPLRRDLTAWALLYLWLGSIALSALRIDVLALDPVSVGPRYFFYPFVFEGWFLLHLLLSIRQRVPRGVAAGLLVLGLMTALSSLSRTHDDLHWASALATCAAIPNNKLDRIPVEYDGLGADAWYIELTGRNCRGLLSRDLLAKVASASRPAIWPFSVRSVEPDSPAARDLVPRSAIVANGWNGTDFARSRLAGRVIVGSYRIGDADTGTLRLRLHRGARMLYRSGPIVAPETITIEGAGARYRTEAPNADGWSLMEFVTAGLPDTFTVDFTDAGAGWGQWMAVAVADR